MPHPFPRRARRRALPPLPVLVALVVAALAALVVLGGPTPAYAEHVRHRDATHDVRENWEGRPGSTAAPRRAEPDITSVGVGYHRRALRVVARVRRLSAGRNHAALVQIVTPDYTAGVYVTQIPGLHLMSVSLIRGAGHDVDCPGLRVRTWFARGVVSTVVPRSCLDDPRWVRVGFALSWTTTTHAFSDDGLSPGLGGAAVLTRRLRVG